MNMCGKCNLFKSIKEYKNKRKTINKLKKNYIYLCVKKTKFVEKDKGTGGDYKETSLS